ncbi:MAG: tetratricopeptide repeat protein [Terriglobales bacterium]
MRLDVEKVHRWSLILALSLTFPLNSGAQDGADIKSLVQQAFELHEKGQFTAALPLLRRAYKIGPKDYFVNLLLGIDLLRTGQPQNAIPYLKEASHLRPGEEFPLDYLGEALARQNLNADAAEAYLKAVQVALGSADTSVAFVDFALARFAAMSEQLRSSQSGLAAEYRLRALALPITDVSRIQVLQHSAGLDPAAPGIWSDLARSMLATGDAVGAETALHQAFEHDSNDLEAWMVEAQLSALKSDWGQAADRLSVVAQHSPSVIARAAREWPLALQPPKSTGVSGTAAAFFDCVRQQHETCKILQAPPDTAPVPGSTLFRDQRWERLTKLPAPLPEQREAWFRRGVAFARMDDCELAVPALEHSHPESFPTVYDMFLLSWCYSREAGEVAEHAQQSTDAEAILHMMRGDILLRLQGNPQAAYAEYEAAAAHRPNDPALLERLAEAQLGTGQVAAAGENAKSALKLDPHRLSAERILAKLAMQERDYATALPYLRELVASNPRDIASRVELGNADAQTGALEEALRNLQPALARGYPDEKGSLHYLLGSILKKMGRNAEAEHAFAEAQQLSDAFQQTSHRDQDEHAQP